jgi:hypothetical protein
MSAAAIVGSLIAIACARDACSAQYAKIALPPGTTTTPRSLLLMLSREYDSVDRDATR